MYKGVNTSFTPFFFTILCFSFSYGLSKPVSLKKDIFNYIVFNFLARRLCHSLRYSLKNKQTQNAMRTSFLLILILFSSITFGQQRATVIIKGEDSLEKVLPAEMMFAFNEFTPAKVCMKDGTVNTTKININLYTNEVLFWNGNNQVLVLSNPEDVQKIMVGDATWLPVEDTFGEVVYSKDSFSILRARKTSTTELRKESGYGGTSSTSSVRSVTSMSSDARTSSILPVGEYDFETKTLFFILADSKSTSADARGFKKIFSTYKKDIDAYINTNKISFKTEKDIITLLDYCTGLGK